jgi:hypothetical protein
MVLNLNVDNVIGMYRNIGSRGNIGDRNCVSMAKLKYF